jgi:hypothetical protein
LKRRIKLTNYGGGDPVKNRAAVIALETQILEHLGDEV